MTEIVLMSDARVAAIPVAECGEHLVDVRRHGGLLVDDRQQDAAGVFAYVRAGLLERLLKAQTLLPDRLRLVFVEGYRPLSLQRSYFEEHMRELRASHPDWSAERIHAAASRYVSPPSVAPHSAGAAVDLTLADADGRELDMGTRLDANPEDSGGACYTHAANISARARANRETLGSALTAAGLVNYPTEWWHWSFGDRYWALVTGAPAALYGPREDPASGGPASGGPASGGPAGSAGPASDGSVSDGPDIRGGSGPSRDPAHPEQANVVQESGVRGL